MGKSKQAGWTAWLIPGGGLDWWGGRLLINREMASWSIPGGACRGARHVRGRACVCALGVVGPQLRSRAHCAGAAQLQGRPKHSRTTLRPRRMERRPPSPGLWARMCAHQCCAWRLMASTVKDASTVLIVYLTFKSNHYAVKPWKHRNGDVI